MDDQIDDMMDSEEILTSMWPENINEAGSQLHVEKPKEDQDMLKEVVITEEPSEVDLQHLLELSSHSEKGSSQLAYLVNNWEYKQANAVRLLREEIDRLHKQRQEVELKHLQILEEHRFEEERFGSDKRPISILDNLCDLYKTIPQKKHDVPTQTKGVEMEAEYDTVQFWKQRALQFEKKLEASIEREKYIMEKLQESLCNMESQSTPVEELSQMLKRADNFIHFILQNAPIVLGHMGLVPISLIEHLNYCMGKSCLDYGLSIRDKDLRYRFIYNHYPSFKEEDIIGKTDTEIFSGAGVKESLDFKREVLERGLPGKREITFETELFGSKTFLIYVEPVFNKAGETIGVNYIGMDITDQVRKREKMAKLREEIAVQKAMETELNKTIHITEETMRAKQMLATMSHEIRSPLSGVVSMAEVLATTKLDPDQRQLLDVMISSGDLVLQLINDILDLSKVESGVMKLEATKFRPREVVRHVLQTAAASLRKMLTLEGHVADDVSVEVIGDVLRIRQILTNLISNAIKFTHEGKVGVRLRVVPDPCSEDGEQKSVKADASSNEKDRCGNTCETIPSDNHQNYIEPPKGSESMDRDEDKLNHQSETTVWICCDVYDTGIGIPESALPTLFKRYMQVSADHARKYGGTGLGLAICKQLVELMGGHMTVHSKEHCGSTFTFTLPYRVSPTVDDQSDDPDEVPEVSGHGITTDDATAGHFHFQPRTLGSLFSSSGSSRNQNILQSNTGFNRVESSRAFPSSIATSNETTFVENVCSDAEMEQSSSDSSLKHTIITGSEYASSGEQHVDHVSNQAQSLPMDSSATNVTQITKENETQERSQSLQSDINLPAASTSHSNVNAPEQKPKILLVEDNKINVMVTQSMMKQLGHNINVVNNGEEAVRAVQRCSYDLILMDVCMPKMDGLQATRIIRSFEESGNWDAAVAAGIELAVHPPDSCVPPRKKIPIIAMTANALTESAEQCYENGMDSFVSKPVTFQKLKQCLQDYLP